MLKIIIVAVPVFLVFLLTEFAVGKYRNILVYETKDTLTSFGMGLGKLALGLGVDVVLLFALALVYQARIFTMPNTWWVWAIGVIAFDFFFYWMHRMHHEVRVGWAGHVTHHSSERYNYATALRQSWTEHVTAIPFWLPMALLGFEPAAILLLYTFSLLYQFWVHTELVGRLGPLEWILNTPSHHRVHHGSDLKYLDRNYAGTFIVWDRLFGTFQAEEERPTYGLITNIGSHNVVKVAFHEWADLLRDARRAPTASDALRHFFKPPGWMPGDDSQTVRAMRAPRAAAPAVDASALTEDPVPVPLSDAIEQRSL